MNFYNPTINVKYQIKFHTGELVKECILTLLKGDMLKGEACHVLYKNQPISNNCFTTSS